MYEKIETLGDVRNLILSTILRQQKPFRKQDIVDAVQKKLDGVNIVAPYGNSKVSVERIARIFKEDIAVLLDVRHVRYVGDGESYVIVRKSY